MDMIDNSLAREFSFQKNGELAREAEKRMHLANENKEERRKAIRDNIWKILADSGVEIEKLELDNKKQVDVFLDAATDATLIQEIGRADTEKVLDRHKDRNGNVFGKFKHRFDDPLERRYKSWFEKVGIKDPNYTLGLVKRVTPSLFSLTLSKY